MKVIRFAGVLLKKFGINVVMFSTIFIGMMLLVFLLSPVGLFAEWLSGQDMAKTEFMSKYTLWHVMSYGFLGTMITVLAGVFIMIMSDLFKGLLEFWYRLKRTWRETT